MGATRSSITALNLKLPSSVFLFVAYIALEETWTFFVLPLNRCLDSTFSTE